MVSLELIAEGIESDTVGSTGLFPAIFRRGESDPRIISAPSWATSAGVWDNRGKTHPNGEQAEIREFASGFDRITSADAPSASVPRGSEHSAATLSGVDSSTSLFEDIFGLGPEEQTDDRIPLLSSDFSSGNVAKGRPSRHAYNPRSLDALGKRLGFKPIHFVRPSGESDESSNKLGRSITNHFDELNTESKGTGDLYPFGSGEVRPSTLSSRKPRNGMELIGGGTGGLLLGVGNALGGLFSAAGSLGATAMRDSTEESMQRSRISQQQWSQTNRNAQELTLQSNAYTDSLNMQSSLMTQNYNEGVQSAEQMYSFQHQQQVNALSQAGLPSYLSYMPSGATMAYPKQTQMTPGGTAYTAKIPGDPTSVPYTGTPTQVALGYGNVST